MFWNSMERGGGVSVVEPRGFLHGLEFVEGLEAEFEHPLELPFQGWDQSQSKNVRQW